MNVVDRRQDYAPGAYLGDDPLAVLRHCLSLNPGGMALEFGVGSGRSLRLIAESMPVVGFDSFEGLPERWREGFEAGMFACLEPVVANAEIVVGMFARTLPRQVWPEQVGLVHIDCDLYSSTRTVLKYIEPVLTEGTLVVFDEWHGFPGASPDAHEQRAWREFAARTDIEWSVIGHGVEQWAIRIA